MSSAPVRVAFRRLPHGGGLQLPRQMTAAAAGMDIRAANELPVSIPPGGMASIPTGFAMALPQGFEGQVRPRSGLAARHGVTVLNSPGTIDADYRGEVRILLINHGQAPFVVNRGERIAQLVVASVASTVTVEVEELSDTQRGTGGFGSTGTE